MKSFLINLLTTPFFFLQTAYPESSSQPKIVPVDENKNNSIVALRVGDQIEISLPGNPTTGYEWKIRAVDWKILEPLSEPDYAPEGEALGAGGRYTLRLKAIATGESLVEMVYRRPFNAQEIPSVDEYRVLVRVTQ